MRVVCARKQELTSLFAAETTIVHCRSNTNASLAALYLLFTIFLFQACKPTSNKILEFHMYSIVLQVTVVTPLNGSECVIALKQKASPLDRILCRGSSRQ